MILSEILVKQLKKDSNYISDNGELKKWVVINKAQNYDAELIGLLLDDNELKAKFFLEVKGILVFNQSLFVQFLEQKNYLNDSYTAYKNKVGLNIDGKYLKQLNDVCLVWPFKDCILEGGQSREEDKREEIFFNEILAQDEITQLLEPKVLSNAKRYTINGIEQNYKFTRNEKKIIQDNLIIKGNNLLALHSLKSEYSGQVKLIYIDPPYNTGNDTFLYNDRFNHSTWLTFMKNRLQVAKDLLCDDGFIFVQLDNNEQAYLKVLMDEIFSRENFINSIVWKRTFSHGDVGQGAQHLGRLHDVILLYGKKKPFKLNTIYSPYTEKYVKDFYKYKDEGGTFRLVSLLGPGGAAKGNPYYEFLGVEKYWVYSKEKMEALYKAGKIVQSKEGSVPQKKRYLDEAPGVPLQDLWLDIIPLQGSSKEKTNLIGQKPEALLKRIIELTTNEGDIVLDFFMGSGSTCVAAHKMKRVYIGIEQLDTQINLAFERLNKVIAGDDSGISKDLKWKGGGEFVFLELKKFNQNFIEKIESAKDKIDISQIWKEMKSRSFLNYNIDLKKQEEHINEFDSLSLSQQKQHLAELLDKNQLYVNLSALNDKFFVVSDDEKTVTSNFYQLKK